MKNRTTIIKKAWYYHSDGIDGIAGAPFESRTTHGETLSKAKYELYKQLVDIGWELSFRRFLSEFSFRRFTELDLVRVPLAPVLESLSEKQRHIIGHANGNGSNKPGYRDYYCTTDGDPDCEHLVSMGLMKHGRILDSQKTSRYYLLTQSGAVAALSDAVLTRTESAKVFTPRPPIMIERGDCIDLESIKANKSVVQNFEDALCRIYSGQWGYYWRPNGCGYGTKEEAGVYQFNDAVGMTQSCGAEKAIWFELVHSQ